MSHHRDNIFATAKVAGLLLVALSVLLGSCSADGPATTLRSPFQKKKEEPAEQTETSKDASRSAETRNESKLGVRTLGVRTKQASAALKRNFDGFLDREPLGFGVDLIENVRTEVETLTDKTRRVPQLVREASPVEILLFAVPILIVAGFLAAFFILNREIGQVGHRIQAELYFDVSRWATRIVRSLVVVLARTIPVAILLGLSYFPVKALFPEASWPKVLTGVLWLLLGYRVFAAVAAALFSGRILHIEEAASRRLERMALRGLRIVFGFLIASSVLETLGYPEDIIAFVDFLFRVTLVTFPFFAFLGKTSVLALLPSEIDSRTFAFVRRILERNFGIFMLTTAVLFALRGAGFVRASNYILLRGYGIVILIIFAFGLFAGVRGLLRARIAERQLEEEEEKERPLDVTDRARLTRRLEQLLGAGLFIAVAAGVLDILLLLEPTLILLRSPLVALGHARISLFSILSLGLIVLGTVLSTKLLRTLLNAKVYPLFEVDIGVAYAINTLVKYVLVLAAFFLSLSALGVDLTAITVVLASLGVGIGFGLQTLVENLISGFIILFGRSVEKGDYITVDGTYGQVDAVGARSVVVKTPDNFEMLIPSKEIVGGRIINWSYEDNTVRARLSVGVSYESDPQRVKEVLLEVCKDHEHVLEAPEPSIRLAEFGDSSINFELLFFFDCRMTTERKVIGELNFHVWDALKEAGIGIPFPQRDLHIKDPEVLRRLAQQQEEDSSEEETSE